MTDAHEALQRADRLKSEFVATLSHELRTPLNAILGWIQVLKEGATPEDVVQGVQVIERNVRLQSRLIEDLLDMSRIESGKITLDVQRLDIVSVIMAAIETLRPTADAKGVRLITTLASLEGLVMGDRNRLQQIIWNLLTNAVKFTEKGGRVHVVSQRVGSHVEISVRDNGMGITESFLPIVFDRFRQADPSTTRRHGGLGLGLAIAKNLAELHGGTLTATSSGLGLGTTFTIHLPLISTEPHFESVTIEERNERVDSDLVASDLSSIVVLAVDDDPDSLQVLCRILKRRGACVYAAASVDEALASFAKNRPHVVLSDIGMPGKDGYDLIKELRARPEGRTIPAIALTALARSEDRTRAIRAGYQMHLSKPVEAEELVTVIQNLAELSSASPRS